MPGVDGRIVQPDEQRPVFFYVSETQDRLPVFC